MGRVERYLSQGRRIELYEKQMQEYERFSEEAAQHIADLEKRVADLVVFCGDAAIKFSKHRELMDLLVRACFAARWRDRRAARRELREYARRNGS